MPPGRQAGWNCSALACAGARSAATGIDVCAIGVTGEGGAGVAGALLKARRPATPGPRTTTSRRSRPPTVITNTTLAVPPCGPLYAVMMVPPAPA